MTWPPSYPVASPWSTANQTTTPSWTRTNGPTERGRAREELEEEDEEEDERRGLWDISRKCAGKTSRMFKELVKSRCEG